MPPSEASAPGSIGKNRPWSRRCSLSALRVMPGSITQSRSSACTASTWFMSRKSIETPPCGALTWPSSEVPVPNGMTGTPVRGADAHDLLHVLGRLRKDHRVRRLVLDPGDGVAVLLAHRLRGHEPVAEFGGERGDGALDRLGIAAGRRGSFICHAGDLTERPVRQSAGAAPIPRISAIILLGNFAERSRTSGTMGSCSTASISNRSFSRPSSPR